MTIFLRAAVVVFFWTSIYSQTEPSPTPVNRWSGSYEATFNVSTQGTPNPSLSHRLNISYAPGFGGVFDSRLEYYADGSFNDDPPGQLIHNINERKFEGQLNYTHLLSKRFGATIGILFHHNYRFSDQYWWASAGVVYTQELGKKTTLTAMSVAQKRLSGGRLFGESSVTLEHRFAKNWNIELSLHPYENFGQFDAKPGETIEYEIGINRNLKHNQSVGVSFFRHILFGSPNDQFSFLKFKYGVEF